MKILLTGKPGIGKSTILKKVASDLKIPKYGVVAKEIRDDQNQRIGFEAVTLDGRSQVFAHKFAFESELTVGKYLIDIKAIDNFVVPELRKGLDKSNSIVLIDEIGRMQSLSSEFLKIVGYLFQSKSNLLATIVLEDESWSLKFKKYPGVILIEVNDKNREYLAEIINIAFSNAEAYVKLTLSQQKFVNELFKDFIAENKFIQAKKLFKNAVVYIAEGKVEKITEDSELAEYRISGRTNQHKTVFHKAASKYECDCNLFNGKDEFKGNTGECSHIMAIKVFKLGI